MIDRARLKKSAKNSLQTKKASAYLVAAVFVGFIGLSDALIYALTGYDVLITRLERALSVSPDLGWEDVLAMAEPVKPVALFFIAGLVLYRIAARVCLKGFCLQLARGKNPGVRGFLDGLSLFFKILRLYFLRLALVTAGLVLFIAPGVYLWYGFRQAEYVLLDNPRAGAITCLKQSHRLMRGRRRELLRLDLSFLGWRLVDLLVFYQFSMWLFSIWLSPYSGITYAGFYLELRAHKTP